MKKPDYLIYATLLDKFSSYLNSSEIYQQYWGFSENAEKTEEQFEQEQFQSLIDAINRKPFESEAADMGTAFNEVIDCLIENRKSDKMEISSDKEKAIIEVKFKTYKFQFPLSLCLEFSHYFKDALTQQRVTAQLETKYGIVEVYGVIDELLPNSVHDIKTTSKYSAFKYKNGWQHIVYPFCLIRNGHNITDFEYNITNFKDTFIESYTYQPERDEPKLILHCEAFIEFLELNKNLITDKKIFNFLTL